MVAVPEVGVVRPTIIRIEVDLPAPFGPRKPVTRPAGATKLMSSTAVVLRYFLVEGIDGDHRRRSLVVEGMPQR